MSERGRVERWWAPGLLLAITALGFWFRWLYARDVSFFVDEYLTVRAAERILIRGIPLLPSGNFYSHGLLLSYIEAAVLGLGGRAPWLLRLPVVLLSTAAIPLTYWLGRRAFSQGAGLVAAALLAVAPEAILWGGRARMYAPLQFFVLAASAVFYLWVVEGRDRPLYRLLFVLAYWASLFHHAEAMLLLPLWALWALVQRGWRWCLRPANLAALGFSGLAIVVEILLRRVGPPVQARVAAGVFEPQARQYLGAGVDWPGVLKVLEPLFLDPLRLPLTVLVVAGLGLLLLGLLPTRGSSPGTAARVRSNRFSGQSTAAVKDTAKAVPTNGYLYLYLLLLPVLFLLLFVVDPEWKSPRYGLMLLPHYFLLAAAVLACLGRWLGWRLSLDRSMWRAVATTAVVLLAVGVSWPQARAATRESVPAYDWAMGYVEEHRQPDDVVVTFLCPAAFWHLGRCDTLAAPADFSGFAVQEGGRWVSGWDLVPIVDSGQGLRQVVEAAPRAWFVVDEGRFAGRYEDDFVQAVWDQMELVAAEHEVLVFCSAEEPLTPLTQLRGHEGELEAGVRLWGYTARPQDWSPGDEVELILYWQALRPGVQGDRVSVRLLDGQDVQRAGTEGAPLDGLYPAWRWPPGIVLPDRHRLALPFDLAPGRYRLQVGLAGAAGGDSLALDYVWIGEHPAPPRPEHQAEATFDGVIRLLGYDLEAAASGGGLALTLYWQAAAPVEREYTVFVHLVDAAGRIVAQGDGPPLAGGYPTSYWRPGEVLADAHHIDFDGPPGEHRLLVGLYTLADGLRLPVTAGPHSGQDYVPLDILEP